MLVYDALVAGPFRVVCQGQEILLKVSSAHNGPDKRILVVSVAAAPLQMCCNPLPQ